jgi:hypothetical protein
MGELIGGSIAAILSLCVLSRAFLDNRLYRLAQSILIGVGLGYIAAVVVRDTLVLPLDGLIVGAAPVERWIPMIAGLSLGILLLTRFGPQWGSHLANYPLAILIGIGAALALAGAVRGTLVPLVLATIRVPLLTGDLAAQSGVLLLVLLTVTTLLAFRYTFSPRTMDADGQPRRRRMMSAVQLAGRGAVLATFGVFFAAAVTTYLSALVGQLAFISAWGEALLGYLIGI